MATLNEYAQLASIVYAKSQANKLPTPTALGWSLVKWIPDDPLTGFSAGVYKKGTEIVIAYTGTNGEFGGARDHLIANLPAALGLPSAQVQQAIDLYQSVKAAYPDVPADNISFTGHSLGGGLAGLMAIYFDKSATTFAPAPFRKSAFDEGALLAYKINLAGYGISDPVFNAYVQYK